MHNRPSILVLSGLRDDINLIYKHTFILQKHFNIVIYSAEWTSTESINDKLQHLSKKIKEINTKGIIGVSASGHLAIDLGIREKLTAIGAISARLKKGERVFPSLEIAGWRSIEFYRSVIRFEKEILPIINHKAKQDIITTRGTRDWIVPPATSTLEGVTNILFESNIFNPLNHMTNIFKALDSNELLQFFLKKLK